MTQSQCTDTVESLKEANRGKCKDYHGGNLVTSDYAAMWEQMPLQLNAAERVKIYQGG